MAKQDSWRPHAVGCTLTHEEYQALCEVRRALGLTTRDLVLMAIRRARRLLAAQRRRHDETT